MTKTQRLLDLLAFLAPHRFPVPVERIMEGVPAYAERWREGDDTAQDSVRRMFERDKDELKALGIPLHARRRHAPSGAELDEVEGYVLSRADFYLPYLRLLRGADGRASQVREGSGGHGAPGRRVPGVPEVTIEADEAAAALEGLRHVAALPGAPLTGEARSAFRKLAFDLDPAQLPGTPVVFAEAPPAEADIRPHLEVLSDALCRRKRVRFRYRGIEREKATERDVAPHGLLYRMGAWYLVGHDALRDDTRTFRVSRMDEPQVNPRAPHTPDFASPGGLDLDALARRQPWELGAEGERPSPVRVLFRPPTALWVQRNDLGEPAQEEPRSDGAVVRSFQVRDRDAFLRWVLALEGAAEIQLPAELRRELKHLAGRVAAAHSDGGPRRG